MIKNSLQVTNHDFLIYKDGNGEVNVKVLLINNDLWLSQKLMAELFDCSTGNIGLHLKNIFEEGELEKDSVTEKSSITASDGKNYLTTIYNLDAIIAVDYRINSFETTQFRI